MPELCSLKVPEISGESSGEEGSSRQVRHRMRAEVFVAGATIDDVKVLST